MATEPTAEQIVATPAVEDDLNADMRRAAMPWSKPTMVLGGLAVLVAVFAGGAWTHAAFGSSADRGAAPAARGGAAPAYGGYGQGGAGGTRGTGGAGGTAGRATTGTVEQVDGNKITLRTAQGGEVTVSTSDSTTVSVSRPGKLSEIKPGATVIVQVAQGQDGGLTAQSVTQQAAR
jgi:hypothetical protein